MTLRRRVLLGPRRHPDETRDISVTSSFLERCIRPKTVNDATNSWHRPGGMSTRFRQAYLPVSVAGHAHTTRALTVECCSPGLLQSRTREKTSRSTRNVRMCDDGGVRVFAPSIFGRATAGLVCRRRQKLPRSALCSRCSSYLLMDSPFVVLKVNRST